MIILRGVDVFPTQLEEIVLRTEGLAPHFQLILGREGRLDRLTVTVLVQVVDPDSLERSAGKLQRVIDRRS